MDGWQLPAVRIAMASWGDDVDMTDALIAFAARSDVAVLARRCGVTHRACSAKPAGG